MDATGAWVPPLVGGSVFAAPGTLTVPLVYGVVLDGIYGHAAAARHAPA